MNLWPSRSSWTTGLGTTLAFGNWGALPWVIGALVDGAHYAPDAAAMFGTVELSLMAATMFVLAPVLPRISRRRIVLVALPVVLATQLVTSYLHSYGFMLAVRTLSGMAFGALFALATTEGAEAAVPERTFDLSTVIAMLYGILKSLLLGYAKEHYGYRGIFLTLTAYYALVGIPLLWLVRDVPRATLEEHTLTRFRRIGGVATEALLVMGMFSLATSGVYAFAERVANHVGITPIELGRGFAVAGLIGTLGGTAASWTGLRFGRTLPTVGSFIFLGIGSWQIMHSGSVVQFFAFYPCWVIVHWFCYSYVMGLSVLVDRLGRLATVTSATYILTGAVGAGVAGLFTRYGGLPSFGWGALTFCGVGAALSWIVIRHSRYTTLNTPCQVESQPL